MQGNLKFSLREEGLKLELVYNGVSFTVVRGTYNYEDGAKKRTVVSEGVARRSALDAPNSDLGKSIAEGRAILALKKKLVGRRIHNPLMG